MRTDMLRLLFALFAIGIASAADARAIALNRLVGVAATGAPRSVSAGGVTVTVGDRRSDPDGVGRVTVTAPGRTPLSFRWKDMALDVQVGIGALTRHAAPAVILTTFTSGPHCCTRVVVIEPVGHGFRRVSLGEWDGDLWSFPTDHTGDGVVDFVFRDDAFLYQFGSYAASVSPPRVFNIRGGKAVDVSAEPAMRPIFAANLAEEQENCFRSMSRRDVASGRADRRNPACAVVAADAARLGTLRLWWPRILKAYDRAGNFGPRGCRVTVPGDQPCPDGQEIDYRDYPTALRAFLRARGYLRSAR